MRCDDATDDDLELSVNWENKTGPLMSNHPEDTQTLTAKFNIESPKENALEFSFGGTQNICNKNIHLSPVSAVGVYLYLFLSSIHLVYIFILTCAMWRHFVV